MEHATLVFEALVIASHTNESGTVTHILTYAPMREGKKIRGMQIECFFDSSDTRNAKAYKIGDIVVGKGKLENVVEGFVMLKCEYRDVSVSPNSLANTKWTRDSKFCLKFLSGCLRNARVFEGSTTYYNSTLKTQDITAGTRAYAHGFYAQKRQNPRITCVGCAFKNSLADAGSLGKKNAFFLIINDSSMTKNLNYPKAVLADVPKDMLNSDRLYRLSGEIETFVTDTEGEHDGGHDNPQVFACFSSAVQMQEYIAKNVAEEFNLLDTLHFVLTNFSVNLDCHFDFKWLAKDVLQDKIAEIEHAMCKLGRKPTPCIHGQISPEWPAGLPFPITDDAIPGIQMLVNKPDDATYNDYYDIQKTIIVMPYKKREKFNLSEFVTKGCSISISEDPHIIEGAFRPDKETFEKICDWIRKNMENILKD